MSLGGGGGEGKGPQTQLIVLGSWSDREFTIENFIYQNLWSERVLILDIQ